MTLNIKYKKIKRALNFNQYLDLIIDKQGLAADHHDEILNVFKLFDYGR